MNSRKTTNTEINWLDSGQGGKAPEDAYLTVSCYKGNKKPQIAITFYDDTMADLRWFAGDRVMVGFDDCFIYIKRAANGTHTLSARSGSSSESAGKPISSTVRFSRPRNFPFQAVKYCAVKKEDVSISKEGVLMFAYPESGKGS